ncbi:ScbA/BarX family gamma-butyrolactone biosynthesis protein [Blastococcus saxobsidens]|uniref:ScbA/BarX family gamma-butyrolactone biosynthesis protein n=1 Tax=Blastococcus saxobsidens TaxID=138336 RepID=UPI001315ADDA|nr:ScbA/BarX family gamma-butyrolactone biosynthesis protein [Blastococcus saxobsidens]
MSADDAAALAGLLSTWRTVDRRLVHKAALAEVLITDLRPLADDLVALAAQWPRRHPLFQPEPDRDPDPLLFVETLRQGGIYLSHEHLGVPLGSHFVFESISAEYLHPGPRPGPDQDGTVVLVVRIDAGRRAGAVAGASLDIEAWSGAVRIATARAAYRCLPPEVYARVRPPAAAAPAIPLPRTSAEPPDPAALLPVDSRHPTFFDHAVDHLPGMLLIDGALRAARPLLGEEAFPWGFDLRFDRFAELGHDTTVATRRVADGGIEVVLAQPAGAVARGTVRSYADVSSSVPSAVRAAGRS